MHILENDRLGLTISPEAGRIALDDLPGRTSPSNYRTPPHAGRGSGHGQN